MLSSKCSRTIYYKFRVKGNIFSIIKRSSSTHELNESYLQPVYQKQIEEKWKDLVLNYSNTELGDNIRNHEKKYILSMFPYPSGNLHLGHVRVYTIGDATARFYHMNGFRVIHPMGWDAFGLPAENAAIERLVNPYEWTKSNIKSMKKQLKSLGISYDWWREVSTCDPDYYKWTQFIFLKLFHEGMAYRKEAKVNWDPVDQTVLANEQIDKHGFSWRSGAKVEKKSLTQWFIKTTKYSKDLYEDLSESHLKNWRDILLIQRNWIGNCNGYMIDMKLIDDNNNKLLDSFSHLSVWMQEPEYLASIGFLSVKSDHALNMDIHIDRSVERFKLLNIKAVDPISNRLIPIIVSDEFIDEDIEIQVGIPCLRERDRQICEMLNLSIPEPIIESEKNILREQIITKLKEMNSGGYECSSILKDWLISRQRYWGTPIPIVYCKDCGTVPVPEEELPVVLPQVNHKIEKEVSTLKDGAQDWLNCPCPRCGKLGIRETDTMDTFVDSSWYFLRYLDAKNDNELVNMDKARNLMPVDLYIGGKEHACLHLYYARFLHKFLSDIGLAPYKEPFTELLVQGIIKNKSYKVKSSGKYLPKEEVDFSVSPPVEKDTNARLVIEFEKMSKSKHNGVNPQSLLDEFGIDALRFAILANVGPRSERLWNYEDMNLSFKVMAKLWFIANIFIKMKENENIEKSQDNIPNDEFKKHEIFLFDSRNLSILSVTHEYEVGKQFHTAIRGIQVFMRNMLSVPKFLITSEEYEKCLRCVLLLLSPVCPHLCCELWQRVNNVSTLEAYKEISNIFDASWPSIDPTYDMELRCVVNDEDICTLRIPQTEYSTLTQERAIEIAYKNELLSSLLNGSPILKVDFYYKPDSRSSIYFDTKTQKEKKNLKKKEKKKKKTEEERKEKKT